MSRLANTVESALRWLAKRRPATRTRIGRSLGCLAWYAVGRRRRIARRNIELCFPDETPGTRRRIARQHFVALAQSLVDRSVLWYGTEQQIRELVELEGLERIQEAARHGPVVLLAPHFIGLDAGATRLSLEGPAASMYQVQSNPDFDAMLRRGRSRFNDIKLVSRRDGIRRLMRYLREGLPLYYLPDMDFGSQGAVFVPFFGISAATLTAPAQLARNWKAQLLPVITYWHEQTGRYHTRVLPALPELKSADTLEEATRLLNQHIETWVRAHPSQYYWVHKRFKTRPKGEPYLYKD